MVDFRWQSLGDLKGSMEGKKERNIQQAAKKKVFNAALIEVARSILELFAVCKLQEGSRRSGMSLSCCL